MKPQRAIGVAREVLVSVFEDVLVDLVETLVLTAPVRFRLGWPVAFDAVAVCRVTQWATAHESLASLLEKAAPSAWVMPVENQMAVPKP